MREDLLSNPTWHIDLLIQIMEGLPKYAQVLVRYLITAMA